MVPVSTTAKSMLRRLCQNVPLPRLVQGSYLTIRSRAPPNPSWMANVPMHVVVEPSWRDSGHVEFQQFFPPNFDGAKVRMVVNQDRDTQSLDRCATVPHISIDLIPQDHDREKDGVSVSDSTNSDIYYEKHVKSLPQTSLPKSSMDRVMFDDGSFSSPLEDPDLIEQVDSPGTTRTDYQDGTSHVHNIAQSLESESSSYVLIRVQVPEKLNLTCELQHDVAVGCSSITVQGKVEGDIKLQIPRGNGDILVSKLRGHTIHLETAGNGIICASQVLEAQKLTLLGSGGRIRVKQIHASVANVTIDQRSLTETLARSEYTGHVDGDVEACSENAQSLSIRKLSDDNDDEGSLIDISSLFVSGTNGGAVISVHGNNGINSLLQRAIRIKSSHGPVKVTTTSVSVPIRTNPINQKLYPIVELGGVNGSCEVSLEKSGKDEPIANANPPPDWSSCLVHVDSLAPGSASLVQADWGNVSITLDRKTEADLRLASLTDVDRIPEIGELLAEESDDSAIVEALRRMPGSVISGDEQNLQKDCQNILIETAAFTSRPDVSLNNSFVSFVNGWVENKSAEPDSRFERKIRGPEIGGKIRLDGARDQALHAFSDSKKSTTPQDDNESKNVFRPLLAVVGAGKVLVETVSWLGAIARRYGLEESSRELGRTASRKGRVLSIPNE